MATYAIGDIQGCYNEFNKLLERIHFDPAADVLWITGDFVNRGRYSLEVLRLLKQLGEQHFFVLGNHDIHLLAVALAGAELLPGDTLQAVLDAPDCEELMHWLRARPLLHYDSGLDFAMTHAGIPAIFNLQTAQALAREVEETLQSEHARSFLKEVYGNQPDQWHDQLAGIERLRCITNYFTRMRFCYADGRLDFSYKGTIEGKPQALLPWFKMPRLENQTLKIVFGHWAALGGKSYLPTIFPLDTGCVWGNQLTAMRLEDQHYFRVSC